MYDVWNEIVVASSVSTWQNVIPGPFRRQETATSRSRGHRHIYLGTWEPDLGPGGPGISLVYGRNPLQMGHVCNHFYDTNGILASGFDNPMFSFPESCKEAHCIWNSVGKPPRLRFPCPCAPPPLEATALCRRSSTLKEKSAELEQQKGISMMRIAPHHLSAMVEDDWSQANWASADINLTDERSWMILMVTHGRWPRATCMTFSVGAIYCLQITAHLHPRTLLC